MEYGRVHTIAQDRSFVDTLADGLLDRFGGDPLAFSDVTVLLPTRRACRALREAFLRRTDGRPMLLPALRPIGEVDDEELLLTDVLDGALLGQVADLPPPAGDLRRRLILTQLILKFGAAGGAGPAAPSPEQAARLAADLGRLIDQVHVEGRSLDDLDRLVPEELADHWRLTLDFLEILRVHWPRIQEEEGTIDPGLWHTQLRALQNEQWRAAPPGGPVIAAGSTGSIPATAALLRTVLGLRQGLVILPGLDLALDEAAWDAVGDDPAHPQYGMYHLLAGMGVARHEVREFETGPDGERRSARVTLLSEALRPAAATDAWRSIPPLDRDVLDGVSLITCPTQRQEAAVIALALREAVETPRRRAALVTPDRTLARRVAAELRRWGLEVDDSAGQPLTTTAPGAFMRLMLGAMESALAPAALLALLKHPLAAGGMAPAAFRAQIRALEMALLRGAKPGPGFSGLYALLPDPPPPDKARHFGEIRTFLDRLTACLKPLFDLFDGRRHPLETLVRAHLTAAEALAGDDSGAPGAERLWLGEAGEAMARFMMELSEASDGNIEPLRGLDYVGLFDALMSGRAVRSRYGAHPRIAIWGPLEARLQHVDLFILGGLNEGVWPPEAQTDAWMSRPMRRKFGLPPPERRIGLSAHDFAQAFCAREVIVTRSEKVNGGPTVPSRWLLRLGVVLDAAGVANPFSGAGDAPSPPHRLLTLADAIARSDGPFRPAPRPEPRPPVSARPRALSVTGVEQWYADPYGVFAKYILKLRPLDGLEDQPDAATKGSIIHQALDDFIAEVGAGPLPPDAYDRLCAHGRRAFGSDLARPAVAAFWWPRFERIARWFLLHEAGRREAIAASFAEVRGRIEIAGPAGPFVLTARADRIDRFLDGRYGVIDYKTGQPPNAKNVEGGRKPQLPLEAAILAGGGFDGVVPGEIAELAFWRLSGGEPAGEVKDVSAKDMAALIDQAMTGLSGLVSAFDDPATPYHVTPRPAWKPDYNDYDHLARIDEWSVAGGGEGGE